MPSCSNFLLGLSLARPLYPSNRIYIKASTPQGSLGGISFFLHILGGQEGGQSDSQCKLLGCNFNSPSLLPGRFCRSLKIYDCLPNSRHSCSAVLGQVLVSKATERCRVDVGGDGAKPSLPHVATSGLRIMKLVAWLRPVWDSPSSVF